MSGQSSSGPFARIRDDVRRYYTGRVDEHGANARGVDWKSQESQHLRFAQLLRLTDGAPGSLLDYGCGYGALLDYLEAYSRPHTYVGFDFSPSMIASAVAAHPHHAPGTFVSDESDLAPADFVVASGILNVKLDTPDPEWHEYMMAVVGRLASLARRGFAFNVLSTYSDIEKRQPHLHYADPLWWFDHCKRHLSPRVALLHDYPLYEFTILVRT